MILDNPKRLARDANWSDQKAKRWTIRDFFVNIKILAFDLCLCLFHNILSDDGGRKRGQNQICFTWEH